MPNANHLHAPTARQLKPLSSTMNPHHLRGWLHNRCRLSDWLVAAKFEERRRKPTFKKSSRGQSGELCSNLPKCSIYRLKITVDNKARFLYLNGYGIRLIDASICGAKANADTQLTIFDLFDLKKQLYLLPWQEKKNWLNNKALTFPAKSTTLKRFSSKLWGGTFLSSLNVASLRLSPEGGAQNHPYASLKYA